jgi:threonine aldolase
VVKRAAALPEPIALHGSRLVVHIQTSPKAIDDFLQLMSDLRDEKVKEGLVPSNIVSLNGTTANIYGST